MLIPVLDLVKVEIPFSISLMPSPKGPLQEIPSKNFMIFFILKTSISSAQILPSPSDPSPSPPLPSSSQRHISAPANSESTPLKKSVFAELRILWTYQMLNLNSTFLILLAFATFAFSFVHIWWEFSKGELHVSGFCKIIGFGDFHAIGFQWGYVRWPCPEYPAFCAVLDGLTNLLCQPPLAMESSGHQDYLCHCDLPLLLKHVFVQAVEALSLDILDSCHIELSSQLHLPLLQSPHE